MSAVKFVTEVVPGKTRVLVSHCHHPLAAEIISQLRNYPKVEVIPCHDPKEELQGERTWDIIIHLAGFGDPSLSETLSHTSTLHSLLDYSYAHRSKLILVIPSSQSPLPQTSLTLVSQYVKNFPLDYSVIEAGKSEEYRLPAEAIIRQFLYQHRAPRPTALHHPVPPVAPVSASPHPRMQPSLPVKRHKDRSFSWGKVVASLILIPVFVLAIQLIIYAASVKCAMESLVSAQLTPSLACAHIGIQVGKVLEFEIGFVPALETITDRLGLPPYETTQLLTRTADSLSLLHHLSQRVEAYISALSNQASGSSIDPASLTYQLVAINESLAYLQADMRALFLGTSSPPGYLTQAAYKIVSLRSLVSRSQNLLPDLSQFLGQDEKLEVAFIIQDNYELRPSGGVLNTIVLASIENGKISEVQFIPVSSADAQLKGIVETPDTFKLASHETQWYLKDANWDSEFSTSARQVVWFLEKEISRTPDVVIGLNLITLQEVMEVVGPVKVGPNKTNFTAKNFKDEYLKSIRPDGTDSVVTTELASAIYSKLKSLNGNQIERLSLVLIKQLESHQIVVAPISFHSTALDTIGWSGGLNAPLCADTVCASDYVYVIDSNVGGNKSDAYIEKNIKASIQIASDQINSVYDMTYRHTHNSTSWPSGNYQNFVRMYLAPGTRIDGVLINGNPLSVPQYSVVQERHLTSVQFPITVTPNSQTSIQIKANKPLTSATAFRYQLELPQQPGTRGIQKEITISYPSDWVATVYQQPSVASPGVVRYNTHAVSTQKFDIDFVRP